MNAHLKSEPASSAVLSELFTSDTPLLDVRAPVEFMRGAFPMAHNLPLLNDEERHQVGIRYKQAGQNAAIELGNELVSGPVREQRLQAWADFITRHPEARLYCFRGGLRSRTVQQWLHEIGIQIPRLEGGYKKMRRFLIDSFEQMTAQQDLIIIAGKTGSGKTHLLEEVAFSLDLEGTANHRGSAFGRRLGGQPSQIDFENQLAIDMLKLNRHCPAHVFVEDESRAVGSLSVPQNLFDKMRAAPLAVIEQSLEERVDVILNDYILANYRDFESHFPDDHFPRFADYLRQSLERIRRRLGDDKFQLIVGALDEALVAHEEQGDTGGHANWIRPLLSQYYDPMYDYQLNKKLQRLVFRGNQQEFLAWAKHIDESGKTAP